MNIQAEVRRIEAKLTKRGISVSRFLQVAGVDASRWQRYKNKGSQPLARTWAKITSAADLLALNETAPPPTETGETSAPAEARQ